MILSCGSDRTVKPMRFAGTCSKYSKSAMPQLASAATHHGQAARFFRCAYQAKVMNTLEATSSAADMNTGEAWINRAFRRPGWRTDRGVFSRPLVLECGPGARFRAGVSAR